MCIEDNEIIRKLLLTKSENIPQMTLDQLKDMIFRKLKLNKACDIHKLTVEHLRYVGDECLLFLLDLINQIINDVDLLSSDALNTAVATPIYKGKSKCITNHKSYRLVRVLPLISRIFDEYVRPDFIHLSKNPWV